MKGFSVAEAIRTIVSEASAPEALKKTLGAVERLTKPRSSFISILDEETRRLSIALTRGRADKRIVAAIPGEGPVGVAFASGEVVREGNLLAIPMFAADQAIGALVIIGGPWARDGLTDEESDALHAMANTAGMMVGFAKSRQEAEKGSREWKNAAEKLEQRERVRDAILSHLSHELRTPLTTIKAYLTMGLSGRLGPYGEKQRNAMEISQRNADRLLRLINDLLLTARLEFGKMTLDPKALGLRSVVREATNFLQDQAEATGIRFEVEAPEGEVFIRGNRDRLVEGIMHLLERAFQGDGPAESVTIEIRPEDRMGAIRILHQGLHLPPKDVEGLFMAFRPEGGPSNLGLSIAKQIFGLHGGSVRGEATEEGLEFLVTFPIFAGAVATGARGPSPRMGEILVLEDDDDCRNGIVEYLKGEHFEVKAYADSQRALGRISENPPALLLVDLRVPGVDGAKLIQQVREGPDPSTPIFVLSGAIEVPTWQEEAWGAKVDGVFEKPINFPYLLERVREYVTPA